MEKSLFLESNKLYRPIRKLSWGIGCFNKTYKRNVIIRTEDRLDNLAKLVKQGWQIIPGNSKWLLRSPETSIYDLSEVYRNPSVDPIEIYAYFLYIKGHDLDQLIKKTLHKNNIARLGYLQLDSHNYFESCCRLSGSDKRIKKLPRLLFHLIKKEADWNKHMRQARLVLKPRKFFIKSKGFSDCSYQTKKFLNNILEKYKILGRIVVPLQDHVYTGFWKDLPDYDCCIFVPTSGFSFLCGYAEELGAYEKIHLWEYHSAMHDNKEVIWLNCKKKKNLRFALIDVTYSGQTIEHINKRLKSSDFFSPDLQIDNIGLFPKSHLCFSHLQYAVFLDSVVPVEKLRPKEKNFFEQTYINIVNQNI